MYAERANERQSKEKCEQIWNEPADECVAPSCLANDRWNKERRVQRVNEWPVRASGGANEPVDAQMSQWTSECASGRANEPWASRVHHKHLIPMRDGRRDQIWLLEDKWPRWASLDLATSDCSLFIHSSSLFTISYHLGVGVMTDRWPWENVSYSGWARTGKWVELWIGW